MNWKRIVVFTAILFLATGAAAFPFGFISGFLSAGGKLVPIWVPVGQGIAVLIAAAIVFLILAKKQDRSIWLHALMVAVFSWILSFPINVLAFGQSVMQWAASALVLALTLSIGTPIGIYLQSKSREKNEHT